MSSGRIAGGGFGPEGAVWEVGAEGAGMAGGMVAVTTGGGVRWERVGAAGALVTGKGGALAAGLVVRSGGGGGGEALKRKARAPVSLR